MATTLILKNVAVKTFDAAAAAISTGIEFAMPVRSGGLQWTVFFGTNPDSITINIEESFDKINWFIRATSSVVTGSINTFSIEGGAPAFVRGSITAISGGAEVTMIINCTSL